MGSKPRGISASRGAAILGLSEYQTPFEVFQRIMEEREPGWNKAKGYVLPPEPDSAAIRWGTAFEDAVVELAEYEQGQKIGNREHFFSVNGYGDEQFFERREGYELSNYITCHIDGNYLAPKNSPVVLHEGKTTSAFTFREKWGELGTDHIPRIYQVQAQHQMLCAGAQEVIVSVLVFPETPNKWEATGWRIEGGPGESLEDYWLMRPTHRKPVGLVDPAFWASSLADMGYFHQYHIKANPVVQKLLVEKYYDFWRNHVLTGIPPEPRNYDDIKRLCPEPKSTIIVPDYIERKLLEYKGIAEETAWAKKRKDKLKTIITKYAATHYGIEDDESKEAIIFRNSSGDKLGSWSRNKNGSLVFRS